MALRKRFMEDEARSAIAGGARQLLVLGSGFDTLCLRLAAEFSGVLFVEADLPRTIGPKQVAVRAMGEERHNHVMVGVDLAATTLEQAVSRVNAWDGRAQSLLQAEGVLMYLSEPAVSELLESATRIASAGSRLVFTYVTSDDRGAVRCGRLGALTKLSLKLMGEPIGWGIRPHDLPGFLERHAYEYVDEADRYDPVKRYLEPVGRGHEIIERIEYWAVAVMK
jgi:methyltransferase (TIGR00027 family)